MAFRAGKRKEVKKQSYYVWFLGAKESKGLRGEEFIRPILHQLLDRERELEPTKVTLQVSGKGLKIVQNVPRKSNRCRTEQIKHFIPHHAITCVLQESKPNDDIVCCILLIYNPLTKCPVHVHAYRCDSVETASALRAQLQALIDRLDNQKKFREIENRLAAKGLLLPQSRRLNSDGRSTRTDGSDRTEDSFGSEPDATAYGPRDQHIASLYDSLAAELRERLGNPNSCPILLPPKDYDTISRVRGRLQGIDQRRSTNRELVGQGKHLVAIRAKPEGRLRESDSSGKSSSGIGSDEALNSAAREVSSHFQDKAVTGATKSEQEEAVPDDRQVVRARWQNLSPRYANGQTDRSTSTTTASAAYSPPPVSSPPKYLYGQREPILRVEKTQEPSLKSGLSHDLVTSNGCKDVDSVKVREREVIRRLRSNPTESQVPRASRPVSYPNHQSQEHCQISAILRHRCGEARPKDQVESLSHGSMSFQSGERDVARRSMTPQDYADRRRSEYCYPDDLSQRNLDERRRSGYFDMPVDRSDYRHSFAEPVSHRMPLGAHY